MTRHSIVIAILTFQRPGGIAELLHSLVEHVESSSADATILVVDNDETPSAREVVSSVLGVRYVHEPTPGIAAARNRALDESGMYRLLVFIDDDERPAPGWLDALADTWEHVRSAAVVGPVVSRFTSAPDPWIEAGRFFERRRHPTGACVPLAATNNLLLDLEIIRSMGLRFDLRFGISGGSDSLFTRSLVLAGHDIVWCDEAVVVDVVPTDRLTRSWVLRRAQRMGNSTSRVAVAVTPAGPRRVRVRIQLIARAAIRVIGGGSRALLGRVVRSAEHDARGLRTFWRGWGMLAGAVGGVVTEYGRPNSQRSVKV